jgi:hypothetical protein
LPPCICNLNVLCPVVHCPRHCDGCSVINDMVSEKGPDMNLPVMGFAGVGADILKQQAYRA